MNHLVEIRNLTKNFGSITAVQDLTFSIEKGDVYGFLGQNGAGKSTTIRMLLGLIYPTSGTININGQEFNNSRRHLLAHIGAIIERPDMYGYLSGWDNLEMFARLSNKNIGKNRLHEVLEIVGLKGREKDKVKAYSMGMKQRLGIAIALVHDPDLLILDEPTNGLDPQGIAEMRKLIINLSREHDKTILMSSHLLSEVEQVATRMLILHNGKKISEGAVADLLNPEQTLIEISTIQAEKTRAILTASKWTEYIQDAKGAVVTLKMTPRYVPEINRLLVTNEIDVLEIKARHSLEAYFLSLTSEEHVKA